MANTKKLIQAAAGNAGGEALNVEDVFSTYLYTGNSTARSITNGIDLDGEGGLTWIKSRSSTREHSLYDTERGVEKLIKTNSTGAEQNTSGGLTAFNSDGFSLGTYADINGTSYGDFASWTFRKAPKFFDVVTYTGTGSDQIINHSLGTTVGFIVVKRTDSTGNWPTWHHDLGDDHRMYLNGTADYVANTQRIRTATTTTFTVGTATEVNASGGTYVAYLFAHNDGDGEFGPDGDADIIKCGSYTGNGSSNGPEIDLGFEPQWVLIKETDATGNWQLFDSMRGMVADGVDARIAPNLSNAEDSIQSLTPTATGFKINTTSGNLNTNNSDHIYIAIRRGPMAVPESATDVFAVDNGNSSDSDPTFISNFPVDMAIRKLTTGSSGFIASRLTPQLLNTDNANAEGTGSTLAFDNMDGYEDFAAASTQYSWMWRRAPNYFDVVCYTGTGSARTVSHNLGVAPEMMWIKKRDLGAQWVVYHQGLDATAPEDYFIRFDTSAREDNINRFNDTAPTSSVFTVNNNGTVNTSGGKYIAYLFASLDGVSKVFSVTKSSGSDASVNCGFSAGPRFVLLKRTDSTGDWYVWDSERGIVAGNDPYLLLNSTAAEVTSTDYIDPTSNGFTIVNGGLADGDYIGYSVA